MTEEVKDMEMVKEEAESAPEEHIYELGYLLLPTISADDLASEAGKLKASVDEYSPRTLAEEYPRRITLAYSMEKRITGTFKQFSDAYFGWMVFECEKDVIKTLTKKLDEFPGMLRFILIKTSKENLLPRRKPMGARPQREAREEKEEMDVEAVDKEIEALVS